MKIKGWTKIDYDSPNVIAAYLQKNGRERNYLKIFFKKFYDIKTYSNDNFKSNKWIVVIGKKNWTFNEKSKVFDTKKEATTYAIKYMKAHPNR